MNAPEHFTFYGGALPKGIARSSSHPPIGTYDTVLKQEQMQPFYWVASGGRFYPQGPAPPPPDDAEWLRQEAINSGRYLNPKD